MPYLVTILILLIGSSLQAQNKTAPTTEKKIATAEIAILAVGPTPPRRFKKNSNTNGIPIILPAHPFEIPPSTLYYRPAKTQKNQELPLKKIRIPFNNPTTFTTIPAGKSLPLLTKTPTPSPNYKKYLTIPALNPGTRLLLIISPATTGKTIWKTTPNLNQITINATSLKNKNLLIKNLSSLPIKHRFNNSIQIISPKKSISYASETGSTLHRITAAVGPKSTILYNTAIRMTSPENLHILILYNANPATNSKRPVGTVKITLQKSSPP